MGRILLFFHWLSPQNHQVFDLVHAGKTFTTVNLLTMVLQIWLLLAILAYFGPTWQIKIFKLKPSITIFH